MLFTVDRLQIINGNLIAFEFYNAETEYSLREFYKQKIKYIRNANFCNIYYGVAYNESENLYSVNEFNCLTAQTKEYRFNWKDYQYWFKQVNEYGFKNGSISKKLSSATKNIGDPYVQGLLNSIHSDQYPGIDFFCDDNGLMLTIKSLNGNSTTGFDFDMYEPTEKIVIEFLKRDSPHVNNLTAHPVRYPKNYQKFLSLWKAAQHLQGTLYLINYSDDTKEPISVIEVNEMNNQTGFIESDIGFKLNSYDDLLYWLQLINTDGSKAKQYLHSKPFEKRDKCFWGKYQSEEKLVASGLQYKNNIKKTIGKNYILI